MGASTLLEVTNQPTLFSGRHPSALFSDCPEHQQCAAACKSRLYRYLLRVPTGVDNDRVCLFVLANPSTATPEKLDPTVTRCVGYARAWGFGWCVVVNIRAWRATDPSEVPADNRAVGTINDYVVENEALRADLIVCGWGKLGGDAANDVARRILGSRPLYALRTNEDGTPSHPLYLPALLKPVPWRPPAVH